MTMIPILIPIPTKNGIITSLISTDQVEQGVERRQGRQGPHPGQVRLRRPGRGQEVPQAQLEEACEYESNE